MKPGKACIGCHKAGAGSPWNAFTVAGTVYPTLHEPDNCHGVADATVLLFDADGNVHTLPTNSAGSFTGEMTFPRPYRAMVVKGTNFRAMQSRQMNGDCNSCHTEWGKGAPGRVMTP
jgi:hypothetical protein